MRATHARWWAAAAALTALVACDGYKMKPGADRTWDSVLAIRVTMVGGEPVIDRTFHSTELLRPGDTVSFACDCPEGTQFTVSEPRFALDLETQLDFFEKLPGQSFEDKIKKLRSDLEAARGWLREKDDGSASVRVLDLWTEHLGAITAPRGDRLVEGWSDPGYAAGNGTIGPFAVPALTHQGTWIWKYAWAVRRTGANDPSDVWDPHIEGHPDVRR